MSEGKTSRWAALIGPMALLSVTVPRVLMAKLDWAALWPAWRGMVLDTVLVVAGATLVAAVLAGVTAWRKEIGHHA